MACHTPSGVARIVKLPGHRDCMLLKSALIGAYSVDHCPRSTEKKKIHLHFLLPGWALVAPSYFTLLAILAQLGQLASLALWFTSSSSCKARAQSIDYTGPRGMESSRHCKWPATRALPYQAHAQLLHCILHPSKKKNKQRSKGECDLITQPRSHHIIKMQNLKMGLDMTCKM